MPNERNNLSRRELLGSTAAVLFSVSIADTALAETTEKELVSAQSAMTELLLLSGRSERSLSATALEALVIQVGQAVLVESLEKLGLKLDNYKKGSRGELYRKIRRLDPQTLFSVLIAAPVSEELMLRFLPSTLLGDKENLRLDVGIPASIVFAFMHNVQHNEYDETVIDTSFIPLSLFMSGLYYWYLQREFGTLHPILGHMINNSLATVFIASGLRNKEIDSTDHEQN